MFCHAPHSSIRREQYSLSTEPFQVFVTPDDKYLLAANQGTKDDPSTTVSIIDTATFTVIGTLETGKGAHGIVIDPSSRYAYVTNVYENTIAVLDIAQQKVVATISTGAGPNGISFLPMAAASPPAVEIQLSMPENGGNEQNCLSANTGNGARLLTWMYVYSI